MTTRSQVELSLAAEGRRLYKWFVGPSHTAERVCIFTDDGEYVVYITGERGTPQGERRFTSESDALDDFLERLRWFEAEVEETRRRTREWRIAQDNLPGHANDEGSETTHGDMS